MGRTQLEVLYLRHFPDALRFAYSLTGHREEAEDLAHEAFLRAARRLVHVRDADAFGSYLRRAVVNLSYSRFRRSRRETRYVSLERARLQIPREDQDLAARHVLREAILGLPVRQRVAIVLRFSEDLPFAEVAALLHCTEGAARQLVSRALASLSTALTSKEVADD